MIYFICATYNEEEEVDDLFRHVASIVDGFRICDDGSTDKTQAILEHWSKYIKDFEWKQIAHTGLPETVKNEAKNMVPDGSWCLMLDADERLTPSAVNDIRRWFRGGQAAGIDYVYFNQNEIIDGQHVRTFQKCKLFRKEAVRFSLNNIHADDQFDGWGNYYGWTVVHRKSSQKQIQREHEYMITYKKLLAEGKIDKGRFEWLQSLHHFIRD